MIISVIIEINSFWQFCLLEGSGDIVLSCRRQIDWSDPKADVNTGSSMASSSLQTVKAI
jgi:hypothetical protein